MLIADSSSLILLAKLNILDIVIKNIKHKLTIPKRVYEECTAKKESMDAQLIEQRVKQKLITIRYSSNRSLYDKIVKDFNLGKGEAEAITLCIELKSGIVTDDKKAINACKVLKIRFATAPRILIQLYKKNIFTKIEVNSIMENLQKFGRYSDIIINKIKEDLKWDVCRM